MNREAAALGVPVYSIFRGKLGAVDKYLEHGFVDIYRKLYPERVQYTWWTYIGAARQRNVGWRIDYFLVSEKLTSRVKDVIIHDDVIGSDHCPVSLLIE